MEAARQALYPELDPERAAAVHRRFRLQALSTLTATSTAPARTAPATYVVCEHDRAMPPAVQEAMATRADRVVRLASSHCPMFTMPDTLASVFAEVTAEVTGEVAAKGPAGGARDAAAERVAAS